MQINVKGPATSGAVELPAGDYWVSTIIEGNHIAVSGHGKTFRLPAVKRTAKHKVKRATINFFSAGGAHWSLVVVTPQGEFVATLTLK